MGYSVMLQYAYAIGTNKVTVIGISFSLILWLVPWSSLPLLANTIYKMPLWAYLLCYGTSGTSSFELWFGAHCPAFCYLFLPIPPFIIFILLTCVYLLYLGPRVTFLTIEQIWPIALVLWLISDQSHRRWYSFASVKQSKICLEFRCLMESPGEPTRKAQS